MRKKIKAIHVLLLCLTGLLGVLLGIGVALLALNLTTQEKWLTFAGLLCLIVLAALCLALPLLVQYRANILNRIMNENALFGQDVSFDEEEEFLRKHRKEIAPVYALHVKHNGYDELAEKTIQFALTQALEEQISKIASIGYTRNGDFLFIVDKENSFLEAMKTVQNKMLEDTSVPPFTLLLGYSDVGEDILSRAEEALNATLKDSSIRESLSLVRYDKQSEESRAPFQLDQEEEMGRLTYVMDEYVHDEERVALVRPSLYDPLRGDIHGKDLFHRVELYHLRYQLDQRSFEHVFDYLLEHPETRVFVRIGQESLVSAGFLPYLTSKMQEKGLEYKRIVLLINALNAFDASAKEFARHCKALGFGIGIYEYGGENVLELSKFAPEVMMFKTENTRQGAPKEQLDALLQVARSIGAHIFVQAGRQGDDASYYVREAVPEAEQKEEEA